MASGCIVGIRRVDQDSGQRILSFILNHNRLNTAIFRAQTLLVLAANPSLTEQAVSQREILLTNQFFRPAVN